MEIRDSAVAERALADRCYGFCRRNTATQWPNREGPGEINIITSLSFHSPVTFFAFH